MKLAFVLCSVCLFSGLAHAAHDYPGDSGNAFVRVCSTLDKEHRSDEELLNTAMCIAYIDGYRDGVTTAITYAELHSKTGVPKAYCAPSEVEDGQAAKVVIKYIQDHPEEAHQRTFIIVLKSFANAFPCH
jgi:hypothetical protein